MAEVWKSDQKIIGENIKKARKAAKLTQEQFAEEMGGSCSNKVISRYEKGEVEMGVQTLIDIAENLEVPVDSLMPERVQVHTEPEDDEMSRLFSGLNRAASIPHRKGTEIGGAYDPRRSESSGGRDGTSLCV